MCNTCVVWKEISDPKFMIFEKPLYFSKNIKMTGEKECYNATLVMVAGVRVNLETRCMLGVQFSGQRGKNH